MMSPRERKTAILAVSALILAVGVWAWYTEPDPTGASTPESVQVAPPSPVHPPETSAIAAASPGIDFGPQYEKGGSVSGIDMAERHPNESVAPPDFDVEALIADSLQQLKETRDLEKSFEIMRSLREQILASSQAGAAEAVTEFLRSGEDAATGLPFVVGTDGVLDAAPSLRVGLLDVLPTIDPHASVNIAREIMDAKTSSDEFAISLRNIAWNDFQGDMHEELRTRLIEMLEVEKWSTNPSAGFLEAFDVAIEVADGDTLGVLASAIDDNAKAEGSRVTDIARAAFIAMDRIGVRDPSLIAGKFSEEPGFLRESPNYRASILSRLDITDPDQRAVLNQYLALPDHGEGELDYFAAVFPNANFFYGNRLVTADEQTPTIVDRQEMDRRVLAEIDLLLDSAPRGPAADTLSRIRERLLEFTAVPVDQREIDSDSQEAMAVEFDESRRGR